MKKIVLLCFLLLLTFGNTASAANWQYLMPANDGERIFFDDDTITINRDGYLDVWVSWFFPKPPKNTSLSYYISHYQFNKMRNMRILSTYYYDVNGKVFFQNTIPSLWIDIVPGSYSEIAYKTLIYYYILKTKKEAQTI